MVIFSAKFTNDVNLIVGILENKFFSKSKEGFIILIFFEQTVFPIFVTECVNDTVFDCFESTFVVELGNELCQANSFIEINFSNRN